MIPVRLKIKDVVLEREFLFGHVERVVPRLLIPVKELQYCFSVEVVEGYGHGGLGREAVGYLTEGVYHETFLCVGQKMDRDGNRVFQDCAA